ncbi:MAG: M56 family metallopeptidase [Planctomycetota bacterium]
MTGYESLCERLCVTLVHSLWQMALLAMLATSLSRLCFRRRADVSYLVHTAALMLGMIALPITFVATESRFDDSRETISALDPKSTAEITSSTEFAPAALNSIPTVMAEPMASLPADTSMVQPANPNSTSLWEQSLAWLAGCYAIGVAVMLARLAWSFWYVERIRLFAEAISEGAACTALKSLCEKWSLTVVPALAHSNQVLTPKVVGLIRPTVLLPTSALTGLSVQELELILAHELAHLRRHDLWVNLFQRIAESILFFNPATWWLSQRISMLREFCCDDQAWTSTDDDEPQLRYAQALLQCLHLNEHQIRGIGTLGAEGRSPSELRRRIARLLGESIAEPLPRLTRGTAAMLLIGGLIFTGSCLWAVEEPSNADESVPLNQSERVDAEESARSESDPTPNVQESTDSDRQATLSGKIVLEDGSPAETNGWLSYDTRFENGNSASGTADECKDSFAISVGAGTTYLTHYVKGFAPAWTPKLQLKPGQHRDDIKLVLRPGASQRVRLVNQNGDPIPNATLLAHPVIHGNSGGFNYPKTTDKNGEHVFEHLAPTQYSIRAEASGYEPLRGQIIDLNAGETIRLSMTEAAIARGVVLRESDRAPMAGVSVRLLHEANASGGDRSFSDSRNDAWWGEEYATTNESGRFTIDRLVREGKYLALIEAADGSRGLVESIEPGEDSEILMPQRHDLVIELRGDLESFPSYAGKRRVKVRQRFTYEPRPKSTVGELIGMSASIRATETGGRAVVKGLAVDLRPDPAKQQIEVSLPGTNLAKTVDLIPDGQTLVVFQLPERVPQKETQAAMEPSLILKLVDKEDHAITGVKARVYDGQRVWTGQQARYEMEHATTNTNGEAIFKGFLKRLPEGAGYWIEVFHPKDNQWRIPKRIVGWGDRLGNDGDPLITTQKNDGNFTIAVTLREECPAEVEIVDAKTRRKVHFAQLLFTDERVDDWTLAALQDYIGDPGGDDPSELGLDFYTTLVPEMSKSRFMATREGYFPIEFDLPELSLDGTVQKTLELNPAPEVELRIIDSDGKPCPNAKIEYLGPNARGSVRPVQPSDDQGRIKMRYPEFGHHARYRVVHEKGSIEFKVPQSPFTGPWEFKEERQRIYCTLQIPAKSTSPAKVPVINAGGDAQNSGTIRGEVLGLVEGGENVRYSVTLETDALRDEKRRREAKLPAGTQSLGPRQPGIVVDSGKGFEFRNVPPGRCTLIAVAIDQDQRQIMSKSLKLELEVQSNHVSIVSLAINDPELTTGRVKRVIPFSDDRPVEPPKSLSWGDPVAGLRAAIELETGDPNLDPGVLPGIPLGTKTDVIFHVKNVSDQPIAFFSEEGRQGDLFTVLDDQGTPLKLRDTFFTGWSIDKRWTLKPGEYARLTALYCPLDEIKAPGRYRLQYTLRFNSRQQKDKNGKLIFPRPGDYMEELPTGVKTFFLNESATGEKAETARE